MQYKFFLEFKYKNDIKDDIKKDFFISRMTGLIRGSHVDVEVTDIHIIGCFVYIEGISKETDFQETEIVDFICETIRDADNDLYKGLGQLLQVNIDKI